MPLLSSTLRKVILEKMATTPERTNLLKKALPTIEEAISDYNPKRVFVGGSFASNKPNPSDIDIFLQRRGSDYIDSIKNSPEIEDILLLRGITDTNFEEAFTRNKVHPLTLGADPNNTFGDVAKNMLEEGRARYGPDYHWKRIAGIAAPLGLAESILSSEDADAMPIGKAIGASTSRAAKIIDSSLPSSTTKALKGIIIRDKEVEEVLKGAGKWRYLKFTDGSLLPMTTDFIQSLAANQGAKKSLEEFSKLTGKAKELYAENSLTWRMDRYGQGGQTFNKYKELGQLYEDLVKEIDPKLHINYSYVRYPKGNPNQDTFRIMSPFAELLEKMDKVTIVK